MRDNDTPAGTPALCQCGCGETAPIAKRTYSAIGITKGHPFRYRRGHGRRGSDGGVTLNADGLTAMVPLYSRNGSVRAHALIDAADADAVNRYRWHLSTRGYACCSTWHDRRVVNLRLHRVLLGLSPGDDLEGDHINRDRLNNRRSNLRIVPKTRNQQNRTAVVGASSKFRGVWWEKNRRKWRAEARFGGKRVHLGYFEAETDAAEAARTARLQSMPFAVD